MRESEIKKIFIEKKALLSGHFILSSGKHSDSYLQCAVVLQYPEIAEKFGDLLARKFSPQTFNDSTLIETVVSPALGGVILGHVVARSLGAKAVFAERKDGVMKLRRGFEIKGGEPVLVVEDVLTTGGSVKEIMELVGKLGGRVVGVGTICERGKRLIEFGVRKEVLIKLPLEDYLPDNCPLCREKIPLVKPGSRR